MASVGLGGERRQNPGLQSLLLKAPRFGVYLGSSEPSASDLHQLFG